jgi:hypothetical protein
MRSIIILIIISAAGLVYLSSCEGCNQRGNGTVITKDRPVTSFTKITVDGVLPVEISQTGDSESVKVETDENLQSLVIVKNEGDRLVINTEKHGFRNATKMLIHINIKNLRELEFNSVGNLTTVDTLKLDSLELKSESVGKINLDINADYLRANLESVGGTTLSGKVREVRINNKSVGTLSAFDLKAGTMMIHNTAVGSAEIYADSAFYIRSSAVGALYYKGPGEVKELKSDGVGRVQKKE